MLKLKNISLLIWWTNIFLYFCQRFNAIRKCKIKNSLTKKYLVMITPSPNLQVLQNKINLPKKELILEIELNGKMKFENILSVMCNQFGIYHRVLSANVEYIEGRSFGSVQLYINANSDDCEKLELYLNKNKLLNTSVEYICRRYF